MQRVLLSVVAEGISVPKNCFSDKKYLPRNDREKEREKEGNSKISVEYVFKISIRLF